LYTHTFNCHFYIRMYDELSETKWYMALNVELETNTGEKQSSLTRWYSKHGK